jgi:hypothetical protein
MYLLMESIIDEYEKKKDKEEDDIYYKLFSDCLKYKNLKKDKKIDCNVYYDLYKKFSNKV